MPTKSTWPLQSHRLELKMGDDKIFSRQCVTIDRHDTLRLDITSIEPPVFTCHKCSSCGDGS